MLIGLGLGRAFEKDLNFIFFLVKNLFKKEEFGSDIFGSNPCNSRIL